MKTRRIYGIDFSAAADAGRKIWIAGGHIRGKTLEIDSCRRAEDLPGSSTVRDVAHSVVRRLIEEDAEGAFGLDFPFGLSRILTGQDTWRKFILQFPVRYFSPEDFRNSCLSQAGGYELKRFTETEAKTPFSPYNLRLYRQTYFGISNVLRPLVAKGLVRVLPMQRPKEGKPWVMEICPASTLKKERLYVSYKGLTVEHRRARSHLLEQIEQRGPVCVRDTRIRSAIVKDPGGDALDSLVASMAVFRALTNRAPYHIHLRSPYRIEGYVFV